MNLLHGLVVGMFFVSGGIAIAWNVLCDGISICKSSVCITIYCQNRERSLTYYCQETVEEKMEGRPDLLDRIFCMDCMDLFPQIPDGYVSMILSDPPYGISYQNNFTRTKHQMLDGDEGIDYGLFARESYRILKNGSHAYFFTRFDCYPYHYECLRQAGFAIKNCMVVEKGTIGGIGDLKGSYANNAEWVIYCQKGRRIFNHTTLLQNKKRAGNKLYEGKEPIRKYKTRFNACWFGPEYPKATYNAVWQKQNGIYHPTIKNVEFLSWLIQISSHPEELVFDGFMGIGSTALAAVSTGRRYLGAEINPGYYETAVRRISEMEHNKRV